MVGSGSANTKRSTLPRDARGRCRQSSRSMPTLMVVARLSRFAEDSRLVRLLASLTHDLRTPVAALATGSELLLEDLDRSSHDELRRIVQTIHRGAIWLQELVENVLFAATVAEGAARIYPRPLDLAELVHDVGPVGRAAPAPARAAPRMVNQLARRVRVSADSRRIGQVLINLIGNASKYSGPDTIIDVLVGRARFAGSAERRRSWTGPAGRRQPTRCLACTHEARDPGRTVSKAPASVSPSCARLSICTAERSGAASQAWRRRRFLV